MKLDRTMIGTATLLAGVLAVLPSTASAGSAFCANPIVVYCNGEVDGTFDAIQFGTDTVSNSFDLTSGATISSVLFGIWLTPGDSLSSLNWAILSGGPDASAGGTVLDSGTTVPVVSLQDLGVNIQGYDIQVAEFDLGAVLGAGSYYLELTNAVTGEGNPVYWDINQGPSTAWFDVDDSIPSESFAMLDTPEPGSAGLTAGGLLLLAGVLLRKRKISRVSISLGSFEQTASPGRSLPFPLRWNAVPNSLARGPFRGSLPGKL